MKKAAIDAARPLAGKRALVTGAAKRMGREIALDLARLGADVAITFQSSARDARRTTVDIAACGVRSFALHCDVSDKVSVRSMISEAKRELGCIDLLVNNAGFYEAEKLEDISVEQWDHAFAVNARGPFLVGQAALKELRKRKGKIINIGSLGGLRPWASHAHYCASKAALHMVTQAMAKAWAPEIAVNCVAPGMVYQAEERGSAERKRIAAKTPMRRPGSAADVVAAVAFFATAPHFITGQVLAVDGGLGLAT
jgi:NAD(P)-dependent dehydrogenase (short-subunit alcohol dehydrogenase family)